MNGYWGASVLLLLKRGAGKRVGVVYACVLGGVCLCVWGGWGGEDCITSNDSLTYFSASTCIRKNRTTTSCRQQCALLYYFGPNPISFSFFGLCWIFRLNVGVPLFDKVKKLFENQLTNKRLTICKRIYVEQQISIRGNATGGLLSNSFTILTRKHMCWICMPYGLQLYLKETPNIFL